MSQTFVVSQTFIEIAMFFVFVIPLALGVIIFLLAAIWMSIDEDRRHREVGVLNEQV